MTWLALDIGGANLKAADGEGFAGWRPFPMWQQHHRLADELRMLLAESPSCDHLAVTMTGELADCFETKADGVAHIVQSVQQAADGRHTRVYLIGGGAVTPQVALAQPALAAASNWHALATFAGRYARRGPALLLDIGSTTCDIIPLMDGVPVAKGQTDTDRLLSGELVYTGIERSPLCALVQSVPYRKQTCPVAQELFATTKDAYLILGDLPEEVEDLATADGRAATKPNARQRLGRMICADNQLFNHRDAVAIAQAAADSQLNLVAAATERVVIALPDDPETVILSGHGDFLARRVLAKMKLVPRIVSLTREMGRRLSRCASAHALAVLAREAAGL